MQLRLSFVVAFAALALPAIGLQSCYDCNSAVDPDCAEEHDEKLFQKFEVKCDEADNHPKSPGTWTLAGCRKILTEVEGENRVTRQCAFSGEDTYAHKQAGNEGVRIWYYQCSDEDFCNAAPRAALPALLLSLALAALLAYN